MARPDLLFALAFLFTLASGSPLFAVQPATKVLPETTKGFLSIPDFDDLREKWNVTQLGQMMNDPLMKPFVEDLKRQLKNKLSQTSVKLGLTWEDVANVYSGEVCLSLIQPEGDPKQHALALLVDANGRKEQVAELLQKVDANMLAKKAVKRVTENGGTQIVSYSRPPAQGQLKGVESYFFVYDEQLVATDHQGTAKEILANLQNQPQNTLASVTAFKQAMDRCEKASASVEPQILWFIEPFGYAQVARAADGGRKKKGPDMLKILADQGFTAIQGLGGFVSLATPDHEILHRTFIYAPPLQREPGDPRTERYNLAARMLQFPNGSDLAPQSWVPTNVATYLTFNWKMKEAFEFSKTLVDQIADAEVFDEVLASIKNDVNGPQIDIRKDLVANFAERATLLTDYRLPINPKSERILFAIQVSNPELVAKAIDKAMKADQNAKKRVIGKQTVWEIINDEEPDIDLKIDGVDGPGGFGFDEFGGEEEDEEDKPILPNSAITVLKISPQLGQLIIASHVDHIVDILNQRHNATNLGTTQEHKRVNEALKGLGADVDSFRLFSRTDHAYRPTYELIRQGKMPEAETMLGKLLNSLLGPDEEGVLRDQQIDGTKMPKFDLVKGYLGPAGMYVRSLDDGWYAAGCLLRKLADESQPEIKPALNSARGPDLPTR